MIRTLLAAIALVGFGALGVGCNDDGDEMTLEEYFQRIDELDQRLQDRSQELEDELDALGEDASLEDAADSFEEQVNALQEFIDDMEDLDPPGEAREAHDEAAEALNAAVEQFDGLIEDFRSADSLEDAFALTENADFSAIERANEACRELERIAADNNIDVDLDCDTE
jgi:vacuolar-type H+-ATPase subunit I/STV1